MISLPILWAKAIDFASSKWGKRILIALAVLLVIYGFYLWAYYRGYNAKADEYAQEALRIERENAQANSDAVARELEESNDRTEDQTEIRYIIRNRNEASDNDPSPAVIQSVFDGLREREESDSK